MAKNPTLGFSVGDESGLSYDEMKSRIMGEPRPLRRAIQRHIEDPLADFVLGRELEPGATILVARKPETEEVDITVIPGTMSVEAVTVPPEAPAEPEDSSDD